MTATPAVDSGWMGQMPLGNRGGGVAMWVSVRMRRLRNAAKLKMRRGFGVARPWVL